MATHTSRHAPPDRTLSVSVESFDGDDYVCIEFVNGDSGTHLTAEQALELAADLLTHANALQKPSDEDRIRGAMAEATEHPGRIVQWAQNVSEAPTVLAPVAADAIVVRHF